METLFKGLNTKWNFITTYHLQKDEKTKRVNQVLEDMLCMYVRDYQEVGRQFAFGWIFL